MHGTYSSSFYSFLCSSASKRLIGTTYIWQIFILTNSLFASFLLTNEPVHEISNNVVCATSKASDQPALMRSLIRAFARRLSILWLLSY